MSANAGRSAAQKWNVAASAETNPQQYTAYQGDGYNLTYEQAKFVANAANAHDDLLAALEAIALNLGAVEYPSVTESSCEEIARAALAKVTQP